MDQRLEDIAEKSYIDHASPLCDHDRDLEDSKPFLFLHDKLTHDNTQEYKVWSPKLEQFRRYCPDKIWTHGQTDIRMHCHTDGCSDSNISPPPPTLTLLQGGKKKNNNNQWT